MTPGIAPSTPIPLSFLRLPTVIIQGNAVPHVTSNLHVHSAQIPLSSQQDGHTLVSLYSTSIHIIP